VNFLLERIKEKYI